MSVPGFEIHQVAKHDFAVAVDWAASEGWNPGLDDLDAFFAADPEGFFMGFVDSTPVSAISVVRYGNAYGFLGFYMVLPAYRGKDLGIATWRAGMAHLDGRVVGLDGVVAQQHNYQKSGFVLAGRNIRFTGVPSCSSQTSHDSVTPIRQVDLEKVIAYDRPFFPDDRTSFVSVWAGPSEGVSRTGFMVKAGDDVRGYGVIRRCRSGYKVGPLFADTPDIAATLFQALCSSVEPGAPVSLDVPEDNAAAVKLAESSNLSPSFETARMYKSGMPKLPIDRTFGITTFELG
ncbi:MAG: GNAT family N-acetyltransferase [Pseudomonadota bacterium]